MTIHRYEKMECPVCSAKNRVLVWDTINAQVNPEAKASLLNGETNLFICRACGKCFLMDKPLLYHDMEIGYMACYSFCASVRDGKILDWVDPDCQMDSTHIWKHALIAAVDRSDSIHVQ